MKNLKKRREEIKKMIEEFEIEKEIERQKIQNVYNVRKQLIEDTKRFFNKKINYLTI